MFIPLISTLNIPGNDSALEVLLTGGVDVNAVTTDGHLTCKNSSVSGFFIHFDDFAVFDYYLNDYLSHESSLELQRNQNLSKEGNYVDILCLEPPPLLVTTHKVTTSELKLSGPLM